LDPDEIPITPDGPFVTDSVTLAPDAAVAL